MADEIHLWEYRVQTVGSFWSGVKANALEQLLNEWGAAGWEVISTHILENTNKINVIAKRPLTDSTRRRRSMPLSDGSDWRKND
ncbi:MAG: DUF4177 domain-containing protein [Chloroflexi bacterium]|nr:DUF4177 domain-containing protein [Chloroflexota bacterium]